ncbi:hypothetical protein JK386_18035 [Nocardioides sp. zg-536]|uniref:Uncharacterized protein n=1 Tax=Nocardioides faecalis TaxID=2803858 RepID=A0A938Y809_9ACTN|nr:hypothetical protein [Nocardioides faecalis]MBS4751822.1 hypothetical protein [Nocardioides faecalis]QVI59318.1 hypothetical protein KG111_02815 [Nocardioides faecalis]
MLYDHGLSTAAISRHLDIGKATVNAALRAAGVSLRPRGRPQSM